MEGEVNMDVLSSILVNLVSNVLWVPIVALVAYLVFFLQVRLPGRRLWRLKNPANLVICAANSTNTNTPVYRRPATGIGQVRALVLATRSLYRAYHKKLNIQNILLSTESLQHLVEEDLMILGGPLHNALAEKYLDCLHEEQPVRIIGNKIIWRTNLSGGHWIDQGAVEYEGNAVNRKIVLDYGLVMRTYNPFTSRDRTVIFFCGSHTYGTIAAAKFFTEDLHKHLRKLSKGGRKNLVVLVSSQIGTGYMSKMTVERSYAW